MRPLLVASRVPLCLAWFPGRDHWTYQTPHLPLTSMPFTAEEIERLSPAARIEVQGYLVTRYLAEREPRQPERRRSMRLKFRKRDWPHPWEKFDSARHDTTAWLLGR